MVSLRISWYVCLRSCVRGFFISADSSIGICDRMMFSRSVGRIPRMHWKSTKSYFLPVSVKISQMTSQEIYQSISKKYEDHQCFFYWLNYFFPFHPKFLWKIEKPYYVEKYVPYKPDIGIWILSDFWIRLNGWLHCLHLACSCPRHPSPVQEYPPLNSLFNHMEPISEVLTFPVWYIGIYKRTVTITLAHSES